MLASYERKTDGLATDIYYPSVLLLAAFGVDLDFSRSHQKKTQRYPKNNERHFRPIGGTMTTLTSQDLEKLDETVKEMVRRCRTVWKKSESEIVRNYLLEMNANMVELRMFLESPIAAVIIDDPPDQPEITARVLTEIPPG